MTKNIVYWITKQEYDYPRSEDWVNDLYIMFEYGHSAFESHVEMILDNIKKEKPTRYAIVTDCNNVVDMKLLNNTFIPNNIAAVESIYNKEKLAKQIEWILSNFGTNKNEKQADVFFTSDTHFDHKNIIKYCDRPWNSGKDENGELIVSDEDIERMNTDLIENWNLVVGKNDIVWHLGDFCLGPKQNEKIAEFVSKLNGKINLVLGNHDRHSVKFYYDAGFNRVYDRKVIVNDFVILSHAPIEFVKAPFFNVFGHIHNCSTYKTWSKDSCCVCVERHGYKPVSFKEITRRWKETNDEN